MTAIRSPDETHAFHNSELLRKSFEMTALRAIARDEQVLVRLHTRVGVKQYGEPLLRNEPTDRPYCDGYVRAGGDLGELAKSAH